MESGTEIYLHLLVLALRTRS
jgi:hypothetical protein